MNYFLGIFASTSKYDADAAAFFGRVTNAGGTLSITEQNAINTLVLSLKSNSIWTSMLAIYPMVGSSAAACAQNLKSSSFTGVFSGGWVYASTGVTPNGTNAYMNTNLMPSIYINQNSNHLSYYSRSSIAAGTMGHIGAVDNLSYFHTHIRYTGDIIYNLLTTATVVSVSNNTTLGFFNGNRTNSTNISNFRNGTNLGNVTSPSVAPNILNVYTGALNNTNLGATNFSTNECAFATIGLGLSNTDAANFYTVVQSFQTSLSRQV